MDVTLFLSVGAIGLLLFLLWVATDHKAAAWNMNLLWALPTHAIAAIGILKNRSWLKRYWLVTLLINSLLLIGWPWLPQMLHHSLIPIVAVLALRAYVQYKIPVARKL